MSFARPWLLLLLLAIPGWWWLRGRRLARVAGTKLSDARAAIGAVERLWVARQGRVKCGSSGADAWLVCGAELNRQTGSDPPDSLN